MNMLKKFATDSYTVSILQGFCYPVRKSFVLVILFQVPREMCDIHIENIENIHQMYGQKFRNHILKGLKDVIARSHWEYSTNPGCPRRS